MEKILTISIAAYNVEKYIKNTLDSLLINKIEDLEILVEDDGGSDNTANIVIEYEKKYPDIIRLIHKENGGYGSTINKSIEIARGKYFKQLDGDDWYDTESLKKIIELLRNIDSDVVYTPYKEFYENRKEYILQDFFDKEIQKECNVEDIILESKHYLNMYTLCYKTKLLKQSKIKLLEKCFYTDTQYAMYPIATANTIYITHYPLYIYRLGDEGQSVSLNGYIKYYKDHVKVSKNIIDFYNKNKMNSKKQRYILDYSVRHISNTISSFYMVLDSTKENLNQIKEFEKYVLEKNSFIYEKMAIQSRIIKILRKTNYNYVLYVIISKMKKQKMKNRYK